MFHKSNDSSLGVLSVNSHSNHELLSLLQIATLYARKIIPSQKTF